ncbi:MULTISPECIES: XdhC family protein [unclassified Streptomyces]|uniref:XdhC family protein n=1 Tax=unclassified Streptomyces TaxID=2593676 RepID=UPI000CD4CDA4|nr:MULTISPECIES: XdhC/CoxI family protein [unclassified Streptomyces]
MLEIAAELHQWCREGRDFAVATVVAVTGSAPRHPGAALAVDAAGTAVGSVSGGCVEGAVYELCVRSLETGTPVTERFGYGDADALAVGLTCGGTIEVLVTPVIAATGRAAVAAAVAAATRRETVALVRVTGAGGPGADGAGGADGIEPDGDVPDGHVPDDDVPDGRVPDGHVPEQPTAPFTGALLVRPEGTPEGTLGGGAALDLAAASEARALLDAGRTGTVRLGAEGSRCDRPLTLLVESTAPPPRMIVFGAVDFAAALTRVGRFLGHRVTVCDARPVFATGERFPDADEVVVAWPHSYLETTTTDARTVLCVLTHDAKFDVPLLERALRLPVAYVGAMGSRRTHRDRLRRLREAGLGEAELARLRSPIGLDLGARTPEETALSIAAEIVAARRGGSGVPLTGAHTPIHHDRGPASPAHARR